MNKNLSTIIKEINTLPDLYNSAIIVMNKLKDQDVDIDELCGAINTDPVLTAKLLKISNSAIYSFPSKIATIKDAVPKLGFNTLKELIFLSLSKGFFNKKLPGYGLNEKELFENAVSCAVYSRFLAKKFKYDDVDLAFTAGLLRDIGKIIIHSYIGINYNEITEQSMTHQISFSEAEEKVLGFNHCNIGELMLKKWNFPHSLIDVVKWHHAPELAIEAKSDHVKLVTIVHFADYVTMMFGTGIGIDGTMYNMDTDVFAKAGIKFDFRKVDELLSEMVELHEEIEKLNGVVSE